MAGDGDALLRLALIAAAALGALSLLLMLQVLRVTQASARRERRRAEFQSRWRPLLAAEALGMGEATPAAPARDLERRWWFETWTQMQATMRGESHARLNRLLCALGLDRHAAALIARRDMRARLLALACFRELGDPGYWPLLEPLLQLRNPIVSLAAADALVTIDPARAMRQILPAAIRRSDWAPARLAWLCRRAGPASVTPPLTELLRQPLPEKKRARLLALLAHADPRAMAPWARERLGDGARPGTAAERAAALEVLSALRDPVDHGRLVAATRDAEPDVRLAAAKALRAQATAHDAGRFASLLSDRAWSVRQEAAGALATLPGMTGAALEEVLGEVLDRYGREALMRAMAEQR